MGRGGASLAGKTHKLRDAPQTKQPHLLSSSDLFCSSIFFGGDLKVKLQHPRNIEEWLMAPESLSAC
jgi:hypothetical protein